MIRSRNWCFTLNNPGPRDVLELAEWASETGWARYVVYGDEIGATGTRHFQGLICLGVQITFTALRKRMGNGYHLEVMMGTFTQAVDYCKKDGIVVEMGTRPLDPVDKGPARAATGRVVGASGGEAGGKCEKDRWSRALAAIKAGDLDEVPAQIRICQAKNVEFLANRFASGQILPEHRSYSSPLWFHGASGTGKSLTARELAAKAGVPIYWKLPNKWWDEYNGEPVVLIEEIHPEMVRGMVNMLKTWLDIYPFLVEIKGASRLIRPVQFILTSNYTMREVFTSTESDLVPLLRRCQEWEFKDRDMPGTRRKVWDPSHLAEFKPPAVFNLPGLPVEATPPPGEWLPPVFTHEERAAAWAVPKHAHSFAGFDPENPNTALPGVEVYRPPSTKRVRFVDVEVEEVPPQPDGGDDNHPLSADEESEESDDGESLGSEDTIAVGDESDEESVV